MPLLHQIWYLGLLYSEWQSSLSRRYFLTDLLVCGHCFLCDPHLLRSRSRLSFFICRNGEPWWHWHLLKSEGSANLLKEILGASLFNNWRTFFSIKVTFFFCPSQSVLEAELAFGRWLECTFKAKMRGVQSGRSDKLSLPSGQSAH